MIGGKNKKTAEAEYRGKVIDSSSSLKEFATDRRKYYKKYYLGEKTEDDDSKASVIGRIVETLLFEPELFDNRFHMSSTTKAPTGNMELFVEALYKHTSASTNEEGEVTREFEEICKDAYKDSGYKWSLEKVLEKFIGTDNEIYYKEIRQVRSKGLTVVTSEDVTNAEHTIEELKTNEFTSPIMALLEVNDDRYDVSVQTQINEYEIDGLQLKSMMDFLVVDHLKKTIQVYDLKCVWSVEGFYEEYYLYRKAYIQAYLYKEAAKKFREINELEYYTVENPKFLVCDSINYYNPLIYTLTNEDIADAYDGFSHKGREYQGVKDIILDLKFAKEFDIWKINRINYQNKGFVNIKE